MTGADFAFDGVAGSVEVALVDENFAGVFANGELFEQRFAENGDWFFGAHFKATRSQILGTVQGPLARTSAFRNSMRRFSNHLSLEPFGGDFGVLLVIGEAAFKRSDFFVKSADLGENLIERDLVGVGTEGVAG